MSGRVAKPRPASQETCHRNRNQPGAGRPGRRLDGTSYAFMRDRVSVRPQRPCNRRLMTGPTDHFVLICATCQGLEAAQHIADALCPELPAGFAVRTVDCMAGCDHPVTVGFQAPGKAQYLFGDIGTEQELNALAQFAAQYLGSATGWTKATDRPAPLITKTLARMPALAVGGAR